MWRGLERESGMVEERESVAGGGEVRFEGSLKV